jgi:transcriptional regulator with XRE-family HTH domain
MFKLSDMKKEVGERLRAARERKGLKQNRVANYLGIHNSTLAKYESGEREADGETLKKMAEYYDISLDWVLGRERIINEHTKNAVMESYARLPQSKKKLIDDMIKALENE